jgi:predicted hydrocarbon binding protein
MSIPPARPGRDLVVPASFLASVRQVAHRLHVEEAVDAALEEAGREAGARLFPLLQADAPALGVDAFWDRLNRTLRARGWGTVTHQRVHPGLSLVECPATAEMGPPGEAGAGASGRPGCPLTTGILAGVLSEAAGRPVEILQVSCRGEGASSCRWAFGAPMALERLRLGLSSGARLEDALASL